MSDVLKDVEVQDTKEYKKAEKLLGKDRIKELLSMKSDDLKVLIAGCAVQVQNARDQVRANEAYQKACATKKDFDGALRDDTTPFRYTSELCAMLLRLKQ